MESNPAEQRVNRCLEMGEVLDRFRQSSIGMENLHPNPNYKYVIRKIREIDIRRNGENRPRMKENKTESVSRSRLRPGLVFLIVLGSKIGAVSCDMDPPGFRSSSTSSTIVEAAQFVSKLFPSLLLF